MIKIKRILFLTDFSKCAEQAFLYAVFLAEQTGAQLHMLHVNVLHAYDPNNPDYRFPEIDESIQKKLDEAAAEHMKKKIKKMKVTGLDIKKVQQRGISAAPAILDYASDEDVDLIVMGTHGRRGLGHLLLGSVAEEVVRRADCSVLTVREEEEPRPQKDLEKFLVPLDFSGHSVKALGYAKEFAHKYGAGLQILHVIENQASSIHYAIGMHTVMKINEEIQEKVRDELKKAFKNAGGPDVPAKFYVTEGNAKKDIVEFAQKFRSDLIFIPSHGLSAIEELLLGSTTEKVVRHSVCPVFTVPAFGRSIVSE